MKPFLHACRVLIAPVLFLSSCGASKTDISLLREQVEELKATLAKQNRIVQQLRAAAASRDDISAKALDSSANLRAEVKQLTEATRALHESFEDYRNDYRHAIRNAAPGMELGEVIINGQLYENVIVKSLTDQEIIFRHAAGYGRSESSYLPVSLRDKFVIDPTSASAEPVVSSPAAANYVVLTLPEPTSPARVSAAPPRATSRISRSSPVAQAAPTSPFQGSLMDILYRKKGDVISKVNRRSRGSGGTGAASS
jgi:hypothetical protein